MPADAGFTLKSSVMMKSTKLTIVLLFYRLIAANDVHLHQQTMRGFQPPGTHSTMRIQEDDEISHGCVASSNAGTDQAETLLY